MNANDGTYERKLAAFSLGQKQDFITLAKTLRTAGLSLSYALDFMTQEILSHTPKANDKSRIVFLCPECQGQLGLFAVNVSEATQTGDDSKSYFLCKTCFYEEYSLLTVEEQIERIKRRQSWDTEK